MANTYRFDGQIRYHDESKLWKEIMTNEAKTRGDFNSIQHTQRGIFGLFSKSTAASEKKLATRPQTSNAKAQRTLDIRNSVKLSARNRDEAHASLERDAFVSKGVNSALSGDRRASKHLFNTFNDKPKGHHHSVSQVIRSDPERAKKVGFYQEEYLDERPIHFSNPAYVQIKPQYRANHPLPNFNNLDMKGRYSFNAFGEPFFKRENQDAKKSIFRQTMQADTPYYHDEGTACNAAHAMVDASHTFIEDGRQYQGMGNSIQHRDITNYRTKFNVHSHKDQKEKKSSEVLQHERRVTYDFNGQPIVRLSEQRDNLGTVAHRGGPANPLKQYWRTRKNNQEYFTKLSRASSLEDRLKITQKFTNSRPQSVKLNTSIMNQPTNSVITHYLKTQNQGKMQGSIFKQNANMKRLKAPSTCSYTKEAVSKGDRYSSQASATGGGALVSKRSDAKSAVKSRTGTSRTYASVSRVSSRNTQSSFSRKMKLSKCKIMGKILENEKQATQLLKSEVQELSKRIMSDRSKINSLIKH